MIVIDERQLRRLLRGRYVWAKLVCMTCLTAEGIGGARYQWVGCRPLATAPDANRDSISSSV